MLGRLRRRGGELAAQAAFRVVDRQASRRLRRATVPGSRHVRTGVGNRLEVISAEGALRHPAATGLHVVDDDPDVEHLHELRYLPARFFAKRAQQLYGGDWTDVEATILRRGPRGERPVDEALGEPTYSGRWERFDEPCIYIGQFNFGRSFGHFLTEGISRLWRAFDDDRPLVHHSPASRPVPSFVSDFLAGVGIPRERLVVFDRPTILGDVLVPHPSIVNQSSVHLAHRRTAARYWSSLGVSDGDLQSEGPVYMSRSRLAPELRRMAGERELESILERRGVRIAHPEELPLAEQVGLLARHRPALGPIGSAFHLSLLAPRGQEHRYLLEPPLHPNFLLIGALMETHMHLCDAVRPIPGRRRRRNLTVDAAALDIVSGEGGGPGG